VIAKVECGFAADHAQNPYKQRRIHAASKRPRFDLRRSGFGAKAFKGRWLYRD
jgi:hypothetical protein